jgi:hypothetical protein
MSNFTEIRPVEAVLIQEDRRTDEHDEDSRLFLRLCKPLKIDTTPRTAIQTNGTKGPGRSEERQRSHIQCTMEICSKIQIC